MYKKGGKMDKKKEKNKFKKVYLKNVIVGFSLLDEPKAYNEKETPYYSLSLLLKKHHQKIIKQELNNFCKDMKEHVKISIFEEKLKEPSEWITKEVKEYEKGDILIKTKNKNKPHVEFVFSENLKQKIYGGDTVNIMFKIIFYEKLKKLSFKLLAVAKVADGHYSLSPEFDVDSDEEWRIMNAAYENEEDNDVTQAKPLHSGNTNIEYSGDRLKHPF